MLQYFIVRKVLGFVLETDGRMLQGDEVPKVRTEIFGLSTNGSLSEDTVRSLTAVVTAARINDVGEDGKLDTMRFSQDSNAYVISADGA